MRFLTFAILGKRIRSLKQFLFDASVPKRKKFLVVFGIIYLFSPLDLIPFPVLGFSLIDDIVLWLFLLTYLAEELDRYWKKEEYAEVGDDAVGVKRAERAGCMALSDDAEADAEATVLKSKRAFRGKKIIHGTYEAVNEKQDKES